MKRVNIQRKRLMLLTKKKPLAHLAAQLNISPPALHKQLKRFQKLGYITNKRNLTREGREWVNVPLVLQRKGVNLNKFRLHKFQFYFKIINKPKGYDYRDDLQLEDYSVINLKNNRIIEIPLQGHRVRFTSSKVLVFPADIVADTPEECTLKSMEVISTIKNSLEQQFKLTLSSQAFITEQEYARMNDSIAEKFNRDKKKLILYDPRDGKPRILVDFSHKINELEGVHGKLSPADAERIAKHLKDWAMKDTPKLSTVARRIKKQDAILKKLEAITEQLLDINIVAVEKIKELGERD